MHPGAGAKRHGSGAPAFWQNEILQKSKEIQWFLAIFPEAPEKASGACHVSG
jgi:hypothetical protein